MGRRIDPELTRRARELRNNPTPAEQAIWHRIARYRPAFTRQLVVAPFIIDLACRQARLGIEFDGSHHLDALDAGGRGIWKPRAGASSGCGIRTCWQTPRVRPCIFWRQPPSASAAPTPNPSLPGRGEKDAAASTDHTSSTMRRYSSGRRSRKKPMPARCLRARSRSSVAVSTPVSSAPNSARMSPHSSQMKLWP